MNFLLSAAVGGRLGASLAAEGIAASGQDMGVMAEAIEQRRRELFVAEHLDPLGERRIGGDDGRAAFIGVNAGLKLHQQAGVKVHQREA